MALNKPFSHTIAGRLWPDREEADKQKLFELLVPLLVFSVIAFINFLLRLPGYNDAYSIICDAGVLLTTLLAIIFLLNNHYNSALNTSFTIPLFVYAYYISDLTSHPQPNETLYLTSGILITGTFLLLYFSITNLKIILYASLSALTILFQLIKAGELTGPFTESNILLPHPLLFYVIFSAGGFFIRRKFIRLEHLQKEAVSSLNQGITKVLRDTAHPIAEITAGRDEQGNVTNLRIKKVNNAFESVFKINLHETIGQEANYIFDLIMREPFGLNKYLLFENNKVREYYSSRLDQWFKVHIIKPGINKYFVLLEDVTKAKKKLQELEINKKRYKVLLEAIPDMFFVINKDGTYEDFVIKESDLFKVEEMNIIGSSIYEVGFPENMAGKIKSCISKCIRYNSIESIEYSLNTPNGTYLFEMRLARLTANSVISISRDITRRKTAEFNLEKAKIKAEESDRLKSAFLANLSHEIRTPLNIITNFTRILAEGELGSEERMDLSDAISQNGLQLLNMIDNTIHLSKIETNSVEIEMSFCSINNMVRDMYNRFKAIIPDGRQVNMKLNIDVPNAEFGFATDRRLLMEALQILIDNAIKYTLRGEICIGYEMMRNEQVKFIISDTGIGIPNEERMNIFSRFYRVKNEINDITSGSGIGLSIAQHYIQLLGGELQLETEVGKGTTFWFLLPFKEGKGYLRVVI